jgi:HKD family nuclease
MSIVGAIVLILMIWYICVILYHSRKRLPNGLSVEGTRYQVDTVDFLFDLSYTSGGQIVREENIFPRIMQRIDEAEKWVLLDMFLFGGYHDPGQPFEPVSEMLVGKLIEKKQQNPHIRMICIVDEVNTSYGAHKADLLEILRNFGCEVVITNVDKLRDSNPLYSAIWRMFLQWFGQKGKGWIRNPLAKHAPDVTLRAYLKLLNIKANHRKVFATEKFAIVTSANPHDASAYHANVGFEVTGAIIQDILLSEQAVANFSGGVQLPRDIHATVPNGPVEVQLLTEGKIKTHVRACIAATTAGDTIWMAMFYLADSDLIQDLLEAANRGVLIRLILDPNDNAFGKGKIGIPNRPVATTLVEKSGKQIQIKWFKIWNNQFHTKLLCIQMQEEFIIIGGSANFTRRSLDDLNLETDLKIVAPANHEVSQHVIRYLNRLWNNEDAEFTLPYGTIENSLTPLKNLIYHLQELFRLTTY